MASLLRYGSEEDKEDAARSGLIPAQFIKRNSMGQFTDLEKIGMGLSRDKVGNTVTAGFSLPPERVASYPSGRKRRETGNRNRRPRSKLLLITSNYNT